MKLVILGATGGIGRPLVSAALEQGHQVTVFVRSPEKVVQKSPRLNIIGGDLYNVQQMTDAIRNSDAVLSAFGPTTFRKTNLRRDFGRVLVQALRAANVPRVIHVSAALLFTDAGFLTSLLSNTLFRNVVHDGINVEAELTQRDLAWTILRPPRLLNKKPTGRFRVKAGHMPKGGFLISRADVANFMLQEANTPRYIHQVVGLCD
jgi:putative NADH-flavin reductase